MQTVVRYLSNPEHVLSYGLGFVVAWFGINEIIKPQEWVAFAPPFVGDGTFAITLVVLHGLVLSISALLLFFNLYRRLAASVLVLVFVEVVLGLVTQTGLSDIAVRDIGLGAMALCIVLLTLQNKTTIGLGTA